MMALSSGGKIEFSDLSGINTDDKIPFRTGYWGDGSDGDTGGYIHCTGLMARSLYTREDCSSGNNGIWFGNTPGSNHTNRTYWKLAVATTHTSTNPSFLFQYYNNTSLTLAGTVTKTGFVNPSSRAVKTNITEIKLDLDNVFDKIKPVQFSYLKDPSGSTQYGFIYEDVRKIIPNICFDGGGGPETYGINYTQMVPILVQEIQSLRKRVASLEEALKDK